MNDIEAPLEELMYVDDVMTEVWWAYFNSLNHEGDVFSTTGGRVQHVTRVTSGPYTVLLTDHIIFVNTDSASVIVNLPAGIQGTEYKVVNTGSSGNTVSLVPNGSENLMGANSAFALNDSESLIVNFDSTDGWF